MKNFQQLAVILRNIFLLTSLLLFNKCAAPDKERPAGETNTVEPPPSTEWVRDMYKKLIDPTLFNTESLQVTYFRQLNDSASYCILQLQDALCTTTFLATQVNKKNKQIGQLEENCDGDLSQPEYTWSTYRYDSLRHTFITTEYVESAKPEFLIEENGEKRFREGYNFDNAKTTIDSMRITRNVLPNGLIKETSN